MADENNNEHENEVMPENAVPVEVEVPENENEEDHGNDAVETQDNKDEEQAGAAVEEGGAPATESVVEKKWPGWPGESVFRMLVPVQKVGGIIGRKGEYIKKTCEETRARIKILDGPPGTTERTVLISAKEEPDSPMPPAMDGLLKVHQRIIDADTEFTQTAPTSICSRLLVAGTQGGSLIGKQGATIKTIQDSSNCKIRVMGDNLPIFALPDDSVVEIQGDPAGVRTALELIATHLRKFLVDRSVIGIFETQMQTPNARPNQEMPPPQPWGPPSHQGFPMNTGGGPGFGTNPFMPPQHQYDNYYSRAEMPPPMEKQHHQGPPYGRDPSIGQPHTPSVQPQQSIVTKVSQNMQIPLSYADAVIGTSGTNISYIRRASGATIAIQETRGVPDEMTVEINGSASQVQTAQQLIQNFVAEAAAAAAQNATAPPPAQGGYNNPYPGHAPAYPSQPPPTAHAPPGAEYGGPVYGGNYGY